MPKVSIIIPVYNVEKYLSQCLDSVINQTIKDIEIICVNDGSTDDSFQILEKYAKKDERIKVISKENGGLSSARNQGLKYATSELCYFLDSDDYIEPNLLEVAFNAFLNNDIDYYCFGSEIFTEEDKYLNQETKTLNKYLKIKFNGIQKATFDVGQNQNIHVWNKVFKTSIIKNYNLGFIEGLLYEDIFFTWYYFFLSKKIYFDKNIYHHYRVHPNSIMGKTTQNKSYELAISHLYNWHALFVEVSKNTEIYSKNYRNMLILLHNYKKRTIELSKPKDKERIVQLAKLYKKELQNSFIQKYGYIRFFLYNQNIFWIRIDLKLTLCIFGLKLKINLQNLIKNFLKEDNME